MLITGFLFGLGFAVALILVENSKRVLGTALRILSMPWRAIFWVYNFVVFGGWLSLITTSLLVGILWMVIGVDNHGTPLTGFEAVFVATGASALSILMARVVLRGLDSCIISFREGYRTDQHH
jgi:hypothetical protein